MAIEGELARAGIVTLTDLTVFTKDVEISQDARIMGDLTVQGDSTFDGDLYIGGNITAGGVGGIYHLMSDIIDLTGANSYYLVIPSDGDGVISAVRWVCLDALPGGADVGELTVTTALGAIATVVQIIDTAIAGSTGVTNYPIGTVNAGVAAGESVELTVSDTAVSGEVRALVEITRA